MQCGGAGVWSCGECGQSCIALAEGLTAIPESWVDDRGKPIEKHPREGVPAHGRPDRKPEAGGEFFRSRGIGMDYVDCFVCPDVQSLRSRTHRTLQHNIAGFVECREAGERVVKMFGRGARLDYRESEPDRVQVKIGACDDHLPRLRALDHAVREAGVISYDGVEFLRSSVL
jgi:hypothetical protein